MNFKLYLYDDRAAEAPGNMAEDVLLLEQFPGGNAMHLRHYGWIGECFTFGYSQRRDEIRSILTGDDFSLVRRPTGGGLVDHRNDWTYSFILPLGHPLFRGKADEVYRRVHESLAGALRACGADAELAPCRESDCAPVEPARVRGVCFAAPEPFDIVLPGTAQKVAGAAMKRSRNGLLIQGSLERSHAPAKMDWERMKRCFVESLADQFNGSVEKAQWPSFPEDAIRKEFACFASEEWNGRR